jgi:hypothetical protein
MFQRISKLASLSPKNIVPFPMEDEISFTPHLDSSTLFKLKVSIIDK